MKEVLQKLFTMFYPLTEPEQAAWVRIVQLPPDEYSAELEARASALGLGQRSVDGSVAWVTDDDQVLLLFFRIPDPRDLDAIRHAYSVIADTECYVAYVFVNQLPDGDGTWDIFQLSRLSYLAHCNRISGPGSDCID